jgi:hypothetical protein
MAHFYQKILDDPRITITHISFYMALLNIWSMNHFENPMPIEKEQVMSFAKISSQFTYFKCLKHLHEYGYIEYIPAGHRYMKSVVCI